MDVTDRLGQRVRLRPYVADADRPALDAMYRAFEPKRIAQGLPAQREEQRAAWLDRVTSSGTHVLVEIAGEVVGHGMLVPIGEDAAELANFLHQSVRGRGIGTELNRRLVALARREGLRRVWLSVEPSNRAAVRSYEKAGFRKLPGDLWAPEIEMEVVLDGAAD